MRNQNKLGVTGERNRAYVPIETYIPYIFKRLKVHTNGRNKSQHCCVLLGVFSQQCCVRLHRPKSLNGFKLYATSPNKCQHCCGSMQTDATCWAQQCCVRLHGPQGDLHVKLENVENVKSKRALTVNLFTLQIYIL